MKVRELEKAVKRGIERLNTVFGNSKWAKKVNLRSLNMRKCDKCVLGQLFGTFWSGLSTMGLDWEYEDFKHGFNAPERDFPKLRRIWMCEINKLRAQC